MFEKEAMYSACFCTSRVLRGPKSAGVRAWPVAMSVLLQAQLLLTVAETQGARQECRCCNRDNTNYLYSGQGKCCVAGMQTGPVKLLDQISCNSDKRAE